MLAYFHPGALSDEADFAPVFDLALGGRRLDNLVDRSAGEAPVAEVEFRDPVGPTESALDRADSA